MNSQAEMPPCSLLNDMPREQVWQGSIGEPVQVYFTCEQLDECSGHTGLTQLMEQPETTCLTQPNLSDFDKMKRLKKRGLNIRIIDN